MVIDAVVRLQPVVMMLKRQWVVGTLTVVGGKPLLGWCGTRPSVDMICQIGDDIHYKAVILYDPVGSNRRACTVYAGESLPCRYRQIHVFVPFAVVDQAIGSGDGRSDRGVWYGYCC